LCVNKQKSGITGKILFGDTKIVVLQNGNFFIEKSKNMFLRFALILVCIAHFSQCTMAQSADTSYILTPKPSVKPQINGAKIFGMRPSHPIVFTIPASGERPMTFTAEKLPKGVSLDKKTGKLSGKIKEKGTYLVKFIAKNTHGQSERDFKIVVGEEILLTPPMGWNSYNIFGLKVSQDIMLEQSKAMVSSGLINHGWSYMNMDDGWQGFRGGEHKAIMPDPKRFTDMKAVSDEIHKMGLKIGIYSSPWVETYGRRIGGSSTNPEGTFAKQEGERSPRNKKILPYAIGQYTFVKNDVKQFVEWEMDYLKYDWNPIEMPETKEMFDALRASGRDVVLSLSNSTPFASIAELSNVSNAWRTGGDIKDDWKSLKSRLFTQEKWAIHARPGHWNDPDMMIVGNVGWGKENRPTKLTKDEQYTHMSAWCLLSVPLLLGNDLTKLDEFTISLLTNDEVIALNQDPLGKQATLAWRKEDLGIMAKELEDGSTAVGLFNTADNGTQKITAQWADLKLKGKYIVRDLWRQKDLGVFENKFSAEVPQHGVVLVSIRKAK
jgi:alpha-galactosidase